jgi:phospholipid N-methyltransferase
MSRDVGSSLRGCGTQDVIDLRSVGTFLGQWLRDPVRTASVTPSGRQLAHLMVAALPAGARRVVEIGAGTGVFTRALLEAGIAPANLLVVEINPHLADFLRRRFADVNVACADARRLDALLVGAGFAADGLGVDAVVSGLGLLSMRAETRCGIVREAFAVLAPNGRFVQFTYGPGSPLRRRERDALGLAVRRAGFALRNLPPATVYVYERRAACAAAVARSAPYAA